MKSLFGICLTLLALFSQPSFALSPASETALQQLQQRWAEINYQLPAAQREAALAKLADAAEQALAREPDAAELLIWDGIIRSTWAGAKGGLGALGLAKQAKARFERALALDPQVLNGSAYTSLASLYSQVPGWPIGFGDDKKAAELFRQALAINPQGIDSNYFYAGFLIDQERYAEARAALETALAAPDRPGRAIADSGRRSEARKLLDDVSKRLE